MIQRDAGDGTYLGHDDELPNPCSREGHEQISAAVVLVHHGQGAILGDLLCWTCAACRSPGCENLGTVLDAEYDEPWCEQHAAAFGPEETPHGPDIVVLGSSRHTSLLAEREDR